MLVQGRSSLVHAGGYPFLIGLPFRHGPLASMVTEAPGDFDRLLQLTQHGIAIGAMAAFFAFLRRIYGSLPATLATLGWGTDLVFVGATSSTYPEWLQASLLAAAFCSAGLAFMQTNGPRKAVWYGTSVVFFSWCVLVKFNAVVLAPVYLAPLVAERRPLIRRLVWSGGYLLLALANLFVFVRFFHYPSTGTTRLTADAGWVLLTRMQSVYNNELLPSSGPDTRRWLALASVLPMRYDFASPDLFRSVDSIPAEFRAPYRPLFERFSRADDDEIKEWLESHPIPEGFSVGLSVIPVCYFVGLFEGNDLGVRVALEAVESRPGTYAATTLGDLVTALTTRLKYPFFPLPQNMDVFEFGITRHKPRGFVRLRQNGRPWNVPYAYRTPVVWLPGMRIFSWLNRLKLPAPVFSMLIMFAIGAAALSTLFQRSMRMEVGVVLTMGLCVGVMLLASVLTLEFRWKEMCLVMPLVYALSAVGLTWAPTESRRLVRMLTRA
jgi:hypothetical protein